MFQKNLIAMGIQAVLMAKAAEGTGGTSAVHPEVIRATHNRVGKKGKDKVVAGLDPSDALRRIADEEGKIVVGMFKAAQARMGCWQQVGKLAESNPEVPKLYIAFLQKDLLVKAGLPESKINDPRKSWPAEIQALYERALSPRISEARRCMAALTSQYTQTMAVLSGQGTYQQKLIQLPTVSNAGRRKGSTDAAGAAQRNNITPAAPDATKPETRDVTEKTKELQADSAKFVMSHLANVNADGILDILKGCVHTAKRTKEYQDKATPFHVLIEKVERDLGIFETASVKQQKVA